MRLRKLGDNQTKASGEIPLHGDYYVVDPCYVLPDGLWDIACKMWEWQDGGRDWVWFQIDGHQCIMFSTKYGDGSYPVTRRTDGYPGTLLGYSAVDSGTLALIPKAAIEVERLDLLTVVDDVKGTFRLPSRGVVVVGDITINTDDEDEDEDEDDE